MNGKAYLTLAIVVLVAACGTGVPLGSTTVPTTAPPTSARGGQGTTVPAGMATVAAWFLADEAGQPRRTGPFLIPVARDVPEATPGAAVAALLAGPNGEEVAASPAISSAVPSGAEVSAVSVEGGIATVDLSLSFEATDAAAAAAQRIAQIVFTLTQFDGIDAVGFTEEGEPIAVPSSLGELLSRPVTRSDYRDFQAIVSVDMPTYAGTGDNPLRVAGEAAVFEATFAYALTDATGATLTEGHAMTREGNTWSTFDFMVDYEVAEPQIGTLIVWVNSAEDGSPMNIRQHPVRLVP